MNQHNPIKTMLKVAKLKKNIENIKQSNFICGSTYSYLFYSTLPKMSNFIKFLRVKNINLTILPDTHSQRKRS